MLDTNVVVSMIGRASPNRWVFELFCFDLSESPVYLWSINTVRKHPLSIMEAFTVNRSGHHISVTFDTRHFTETAVTQLLNRLYIEYLAQRINFGEDIEVLGEELKRDWWQQNKERILAKIHAENSNS